MVLKGAATGLVLAALICVVTSNAFLEKPL